jgi:hypothetical protein
MASGGANGLIALGGPVPWNARLRSAWYIPTDASQAATKSTSYRLLTLVNVGTGGAGTVVMANLTMSATIASLVAQGFAVNTDTSATVPAGQVVAASQITVGGTDANGTVLRAGQIFLSWEVI